MVGTLLFALIARLECDIEVLLCILDGHVALSHLLIDDFKIIKDPSLCSLVIHLLCNIEALFPSSRLPFRIGRRLDSLVQKNCKRPLLSRLIVQLGETKKNVKHCLVTLDSRVVLAQAKVRAS